MAPCAAMMYVRDVSFYHDEEKVLGCRGALGPGQPVVSALLGEAIGDIQ